ncbi:MAG: SRPBCC family protein [Gammaproteobacteria bacterium]
MRILDTILGGALFLTAVFLIGGFLIPSEWSISRSIVVHANIKEIYPLVSNFREWSKWSPWSSAKDSTLRYTYSGPEVGVGSKQSWTSKTMGNGWMECTSVTLEDEVGYDLYIDIGFLQSTLYGNIKFISENNDTKVIWIDKGWSDKNLLKRWMNLVMKRMLSKDIDICLSGLKTLVEKSH